MSICLKAGFSFREEIKSFFGVVVLPDNLLLSVSVSVSVSGGVTVTVT